MGNDCSGGIIGNRGVFSVPIKKEDVAELLREQGISEGYANTLFNYFNEADTFDSKTNERGSDGVLSGGEFTRFWASLLSYSGIPVENLEKWYKECEFNMLSFRLDVASMAGLYTVDRIDALQQDIEYVNCLYESLGFPEKLKSTYDSVINRLNNELSRLSNGDENQDNI